MCAIYFSLFDGDMAFIHSLVLASIHSLSHPLVHPFIALFIHSFIPSLLHSLTHLLARLHTLFAQGSGEHSAK